MKKRNLNKIPKVCKTVFFRENNKIAIAVCGPAHSGKSVFLSQLYSVLPTKRTYLIRGCPDGEGIWSNGENQHDIQIFRKKGKFDEEFVNQVVSNIERARNEIVLVDVGGIPSEENVKIMSHCDYYVILSNNKEKAFKWEKFVDSFKPGSKVPVQKLVKKGEETIIVEKEELFDDIVQDMGKKSGYLFRNPREPRLLATFQSELGREAEASVYLEDNILKGKVTNLVRGSYNRELPVFALAYKILEEAKKDENSRKEKTKLKYDDNDKAVSKKSLRTEIDMNILKEYIFRYITLFSGRHKYVSYRVKSAASQRIIDVRMMEKKKYERIIEERVKLAKYMFLFKRYKGMFRENCIDMNKVASFLKMTDRYGHINWRTDKLKEIMIILSNLTKDMDDVEIYGFIPNWLSGAIGELRKDQPLKIYQKSKENYGEIKRLPKDSNESKKSFIVLEGEKSVILHWTGDKKYFDSEDVYLPDIPEDKDLYISGRLSSSAVASIVQSYDNPEKSVNVPGVGFVKCVSKKFESLGTVERQPRDIDFIEYVEKESGR